MRLSNDELVADRYRVTGPADTSGTDVYEAVDERFGRRVLVKVLDADAPPEHETGVLDGGEHDGLRYVVLTVYEVAEDATAAVPMVETTAVPVVESAPVSAASSQQRRSLVPIAAAVTIAVLVIGTIVFALGQDTPSDTAEPVVSSTTTAVTTRVTQRERPQTTAPPATDPPTTDAPIVEIPTTEATTPDTTDAPVVEEDTDTSVPE